MAKTLALVFGIVFVLVGLLGFVSNPIVGATGLFATNGLHNLVHLLIGVVLIVAGRGTPATATRWLKYMGVLYLILAAIGFIFTPNGPSLLGLGLVTVNLADQFLHLVLGVVLLIAAYASGSSSSQTGAIA